MKPEIGNAPQRTYRKVVEKMLSSLNAGEYPSGARLPPERELSDVIEGGADAVLAASIFHFGEYTVPQAKEYMQERGVEVRL